MPHDPLINFEIKKYFQKEPKFSGFIQEIIYLE